MDDGVEMASPTRLILIGYWVGPAADHSWPDPRNLIDHEWNGDDRDLIASYLSSGLVIQSFMGISICRICGRGNGATELTDGTFVWPEGLSHYVSDHGVRLPERFVSHAIDRVVELENLERDTEWWRPNGQHPA